MRTFCFMLHISYFILLPVLATAQPDTLWTRVLQYGYGENQYAIELLCTPNGGAALAGNLTLFQMSFRHIGLDADGIVLWQNGVGVQNGAWCTSMVTTMDGGWMMGGYRLHSAGGKPSAYVVRMDSSGQYMWARAVGSLLTGETIRAIMLMDDGGFLMAGEFTDTTVLALPDVYLIRMNAQGDTLWTRVHAQPTTETVASICMLTDGNVLIGGSRQPFDSGLHFYFLKITTNGDTLWTRTYGAGDYDVVCKVLPTPDGGAVFGGTTTSFEMYGDFCLGKISGNGDSLWLRLFGGVDEDLAHDLAPMAGGGYLICGQSKSFGDANGDAYLVRTDADGDPQWSYLYGEIGHYEILKTVTQTADGGIIFAGDFHSELSADIFVVRMDQEQSAEPVPPVATHFALDQNYPNPFNPITTITFDLPTPATVELSVYNIAGQKVTSLTQESLSSGRHSRIFDASHLASGVYVYRLETRNFSDQKKMVLIK